MIARCLGRALLHFLCVPSKLPKHYGKAHTSLTEATMASSVLYLYGQDIALQHSTEIEKLIQGWLNTVSCISYLVEVQLKRQLKLSKCSHCRYHRTERPYIERFNRVDK